MVLARELQQKRTTKAPRIDPFTSHSPRDYICRGFGTAATLGTEAEEICSSVKVAAAVILALIT